MAFIRKITNFIIYSSLWMATCAAAMVTYTYDVTGSGIVLDAYVGFVFCGTFVLYSAHRLIGIEKVRQFDDKGRFEIINRYKAHILISGILGMIGGAWFFFHLDFWVILWLMAPAVLSAFYIIPVKNGKRLRDRAYVKIFIISGIWGILTGLIPFLNTGNGSVSESLMLFLERTLFVFAIAIPFDIRDVQVDQRSGVRTFPLAIGIRKAKFLSLGALALSGIFSFQLINTGTYDVALVAPYSICLILTAAVIWHSRPELDDLYFSGLVDGMLFLIACSYWIWAMTP